MREPVTKIDLNWKGRSWFFAVSGCGFLVAGILLGRFLFPIEIAKPFIVEKEKCVEVPVDRIVEKKVPVEIVKYVDRVVEKRVEVPVEVIRYVERPNDGSREVQLKDMTPTGLRAERPSKALDDQGSPWGRLRVGQTRGQVRSILGQPSRMEGTDWEYWYYGQDNSRPKVVFLEGKVWSWMAP